MKRNAPKIGQTLYSLNVGNAARNVEQKLTPVVVSAVGRKYFTCGKGWSETQYYLDTWHEKTDYTARSCLYENEQEWIDDKECSDIESMMRTMFGTFRRIDLSLDQLRRIKSIVEQNV